MTDNEFQAWLDGAQAYNDGERLSDYVFTSDVLKNAFYDGYHRCLVLDQLTEVDQEIGID